MDGERERQRIETEKKRWGDRTEEWLCDAAMRGDVGSLKEIIAKDEYILDKVLVGGFKGKNPLHVAISTGQQEFVLQLLRTNPELAEVVDTELGTALHIASSKGHVEIAEHVVRNSPGMCMACNREGNNPLHIAAMKGKVEVLKVLLRTCPQAAQVRVDQGYTVLHLCVINNQLKSLEELLHAFEEDPDFVASTDINGNNILHLAVFNNRHEIVKHVLEKAKIDVNARNGSGWTALDINSRVAKSEDSKANGKDNPIRGVLHKKEAKTSDKLFFPFDPSWQKKKKDTLMIVSSLMATMAFQVGVNPPGGVWQDNSGDHAAGKAITAYEYQNAYQYFMYFNTVGLLLSLTTILELIVVFPAKKKAFGIIGAGISWLTIMTMAFTYTFSIIVVSPTEEYKYVSRAILVTVIVWAVVISSVHVVPYIYQETIIDVMVMIVKPIVFILFLVRICCWVLCCAREEQSGNKASKGTVQSQRDNDAKKVGEENDTSV